ncbi:MAG: hypothetical protein LBU82_02305 [Treponema sp.]|jgi:hypothetical protein|nr:hypothetical protein [Treponema sp.]
MKKIFAMLLAGFLAASFASALDKENFLELSGEIKTGFLFERRDEGDATASFARINNNDGDAGSSEGRARVGIALQSRNVGIRTRFYQDTFRRGTGANDPNLLKLRTDFAYAYGTAFNSQLKISAGLLGESPWATGGPEVNEELEKTDSARTIMGIRTEWKPTFSPFWRGLNLGFVLNRANENIPAEAKEVFGDLFNESIVGIAWENQYFGLRFAYRFDRDVKSSAAVVSGEKFAYRIEERLLWNLLPGFQISANGYCDGINSEGKGAGRNMPGYIQNWLYIRYDPMDFSTGFDAGYRDNFVRKTGQILELRPFFYYKFLNNYVTAGVLGGIVMGFNGPEKSYPDVFYNSWYVEPQVKLRVNNNFYIALVYRYTSNAFETADKEVKFDHYTQWVNLRLSYSY